jgi:hypothetical protein
MSLTFLNRVAWFARSAKSVYVNGRTVTPVRSYLCQQVMQGNDAFFLSRSIRSTQSFELQRNHGNLIKWIQSQGWEVDLHRHETQECTNWQEENVKKRTFRPIYTTSLFVRLRASNTMEDDPWILHNRGERMIPLRFLILSEMVLRYLTATELGVLGSTFKVKIKRYTGFQHTILALSYQAQQRKIACSRQGVFFIRNHRLHFFDPSKSQVMWYPEKDQFVAVYIDNGCKWMLLIDRKHQLLQADLTTGQWPPTPYGGITSPVLHLRLNHMELEIFTDAGIVRRDHRTSKGYIPQWSGKSKPKEKPHWDTEGGVRILVDSEGKLMYGNRNLAQIVPTQRFVDCTMHGPFIGVFRNDGRFECFVQLEKSLNSITVYPPLPIVRVRKPQSDSAEKFRDLIAQDFC